jgi:tetratricopeptide (TPR) repeat protein
LAPYLWKIKGAKPAGYFQQGWEKKYAMIRMDQWESGSRTTVLHEYTHSVLHLNAHWLPTWLDEGLAEFYGYTQFRKGQTLIGAPTELFPIFSMQPLIPIKTLITVDENSPYYHDEDKVAMFYAESWALVHYMTFSPDMGGGQKLAEYFAKIQQPDVDQKKAFEEVFGGFGEMDSALRTYVNKFSFRAGVVKNPPHLTDPKDYASRTLSVAETQAELGGYQLWTHDIDHARKHVTDALREDPKLGLAHEEQGFLDFFDGKNAESIGEFTQAFADDGNLYLSLFAKTMLSALASSSKPADEERFQNALEDVTNLNPQYAPAYVELARLALRQGNLGTAFVYSRKAEDLEPFRAGYHLQTGQILLRMGKVSDAANFAKYVAEHWYGSDHNEALELWNEIPKSQRPPSDPMAESAPKDTREAEGHIRSVTCDNQGNWTLDLDQDGRISTFHGKSDTAYGFSDTLWYGEDHITLCHHLEGLRVIVHFKSAADPSYAGDAAEIEIRDDLPALPMPAKTISPTTAPTEGDPK